MKKIIATTVAVMLLVITAVLAKPVKNECTTIQDGTLLTSEGDIIPMGFITEGPRAGYNYQAHLFNGLYGTDYLVMKWNDAWLSNKDCDGDGLLDRPLDENGAQYYFGSGAWLTNHWRGEYMDGDNLCIWSEFIKIVALPVDAKLDDGVWYDVDGTRIGESIWGQFAIVQDMYKDSCGGSYKVLEPNPGLGNK